MGQNALTNLTKELKEVGLKDFSNPQSLIQNFFKEGDSKITPDERVFLCSVIVTSEYIIGKSILSYTITKMYIWLFCSLHFQSYVVFNKPFYSF